MKKFLFQSLFLTALLVLGATGAFADTFTLWSGDPAAKQVEGQTNQYSIDLSGKFANYETITALTFSYTGSNARANSFNDASWIVGSQIKIVADEQDLITTGEKDILVAATTHEITITNEQAETLKSATNVTIVFKNLTLGKIELTGTEKKATPDPEKVLEDGTYYLRNVAAKKFWGAGSSWGTQATLVEEYQYVKLAMLEDGKYTMETMVSNGGTNYYFAGDFMDGAATGLDVAKSGNYYTFALNGAYFGYDGSSDVLGKGLTADSENALWEVLTQEAIDKEIAARKANLATATADDPEEATFLIKDADFGRNRRDALEVWTIEASNKNLAGGGDNGNGCAESYHSTFTLSQVLSDMPKGVYKFTAQGFYRQDGTDNDNLPVFYINDATSTFPVKTGSENSMTEAGASFLKGDYAAEAMYVELTQAGDLTIGAKLETNTNLWCIWDNFELEYYGPNANMDDVKNKAIKEEMEDLAEDAEELKGNIENETVKAEIEAAIAEAAQASGADAINAAIAKLKAAIDKAEAQVIAKDVLPKMKQLTETTNVYTQEAYDAYYTQWEAKYKDGTLTKAEASANVQDPFLVTGWHANIAVDNFLLNAWDTNPDFVDAPYYINSWSTEGENDGSDFKVPFFEYWVADAESLGEKTLTATMTGLEAGNYDVKALVRVRMKNGASAPTYGITMQANDGEAVDVAAGDQIGSSQLYLKEFTATGTVAEDGTLKIKFIVAADNNISWLAFKNVNFAKSGDTPEPQPSEDVLYSWESPEGTPIETGGKISYENGDGERLNYLNAGYYTICLNGKKANLADETPSANAGHMLVTLDNAVSNEYKVQITGYINKDATGKKASAWFAFENGEGIESAIYSDEANINEAVGGAITTTEFVIPEDANGSKTFKMTRGQSGTNLFITKLVICKAGTQDGITTVKAGKFQNNKYYNLNGQEVITPTKGLYIINGKKVVIK